MAQEIINIGSSENDGTGDALRNAFIKSNNNFTELYSDKQDTLISGTNIKTINGNSILGAGNLFISSGITGSGTDNYIPRFNGTTALENSIIYDNGTNVGIGTTSPSAKLDVNGSINMQYNTGNKIAFGATDTFSADSTTIAQYGITNAGSLGQWLSGYWGLKFATLGSEKMRITTAGNVGIGTTTPLYPLHVNGQVTNISIFASNDIVAFSDQSVKNNIRPIENVIEKIQNSRGVVYDRVDSGTKDNIGFIAQELEVNFPELVVTNEDGTKAVKYQNTVAVLFEAIKEQQKQIEELKQIVNGFTK